MTPVGPVKGFDAIRMLLALGFRIGRSNGSVVALEKSGRIVFLSRDDDVSPVTLTAILEAAQIGPAVAYRILARLNCRDTLPDTSL
ncbi:MAG TPA: type II toxin-antitoxin system HicA family toxin [Polyangiaceae bacterium]